MIDPSVAAKSGTAAVHGPNWLPPAEYAAKMQAGRDAAALTASHGVTPATAAKVVLAAKTGVAGK